MKFTRLQKIAFCSFVLFGVLGLVPPWFVDFHTVDPKYSVLEVVLLLISGCVCLILCRIADHERERRRQGGFYEDRA